MGHIVLLTQSTYSSPSMFTGSKVMFGLAESYIHDYHLFVDITPDPIYYKVKAIDYWGRSGAYSDASCVQCHR